MAHSYALAATARQADSYIEQGIDFFGGFAVEATAIEGIVDISALISLFNLDLPGSPFAPDRPIDILEVPANPFLQVRHAVSPIDKRAVLGGIVEFPPYDGTGTVRAGEIETDLLWIEPTRLSIGSRLLRYYPGQREPQVRGIYHGVTWGWEDCETGHFRAFTPSHLVGSAISRVWGETPVDIETDAAEAPVAVQMVCPQPPEEESGFEHVESGLFAKRIAYHTDLSLHEPHLVGRVDSIPVRVVRTMNAENGKTLAFCVAILLDMPLVFAHGFERWAQGVAVKTVPFDEVEDLHLQTVEVIQVNPDIIPVVTVLPTDEDDAQRILGQAFLLLSSLLPQGWTKASILVQVIGEAIGVGGEVTMSDGQGGMTTEQIESIPSAFKAYGIWFKEQHLDPQAGAPLSVRFDFEAGTRNVDIELNYMNEPEGAESVPAEQWAIEVERFPRGDGKTPQWLAERVEYALARETEKAEQARYSATAQHDARAEQDAESAQSTESPEPASSLKKKAEEAARELFD